MSVVPPPMSTSATPSSFSSSVSTDSLAASCSTTVSATVDAGAVHAGDDVLRRALAAGDDVDVHLEPRAGHADRRADAVLLVDDEVLRQHVQDFAAGRQRHRLRGVDRAPHVLAGDLAVLAGDGNHAAAVEALDVRPGQREVHRVDLDAGHQLGLLDRLLDRFDRRLEVDDDAAPDAARLGDAEADDVERRRRRAVSPTTRRHLRGADVEADQIPFFSRHYGRPCSLFSSTGLPRLRAARRFGPDARRCARRTANRRSRCPARARAAPAPDRDTTGAARRNWSSPSCSTAGSPLEDHRRVVQVGDVDLRQPRCAISGFALDSAAITPRGELGARFVGQPRRPPPARQARR